MTYATPTAISRANAAGLNLSLANWRDIFLAITDEIAGDTGRQSCQSPHHRSKGKLRKGFWSMSRLWN